MDKYLDFAIQQIEHLQDDNQQFSSMSSCLKDLQADIYGEIQALGDTMRQFYEEMITLHKAVVPLHDMQKRSRENVKVLKLIHAAINTIQEWGNKYKEAPIDLARKTRQEAELEKVKVKMLIQSKKPLGTCVANIIFAFA